MRALRDEACRYADLGWYVLPLRPRGKSPLGGLVPHGMKDATPDLARVFGWWRQAPTANVGVVCGPSGLVVLDVDPRNGGDDSLHELEGQLGQLPETPTALTGGGGAHYVFRHPGEVLVGVAADGLDVKDHGYIVAPPSVHPSGRGYEWEVDPQDAPAAELPRRWLDHLRPSVRVAQRGELTVNVSHGDALRRIPSAVYVARLTGQEVDRQGWASCPFHGSDSTPSLKCDGTLWACYGCPPPPGKRANGGNVYDFAGLLGNYPLPLRGIDFVEVREGLTRLLG